MFSLTVHIIDLPSCYRPLLLEISIFIVLGKQGLILSRHEMFVAICVGVVDFYMPECCGLKLFYNFLQNFPPPFVLCLMTAP